MKSYLDREIHRRNTALIGLDLDYARELFPAASSNQVLLASMHKARYEIPAIPAELRHASGNWLREHGFGRFDGSGLLPEGLLP